MRGDACTVPPHAALRVNNDVTAKLVRAGLTMTKAFARSYYENSTLYTDGHKNRNAVLCGMSVLLAPSGQPQNVTSKRRQ